MPQEKNSSSTAIEQPKPVFNTLVTFEDNGQDFLTWLISPYGLILECKPFQASIWCKHTVITKVFTPGKHLVTSLDGETLTIKHKIAKVEKVPATPKTLAVFAGTVEYFKHVRQELFVLNRNWTFVHIKNRRDFTQYLPKITACIHYHPSNWNAELTQLAYELRNDCPGTLIQAIKAPFILETLPEHAFINKLKK